MEQNPKEKEILTELNTGHKTWTELEQNLKMSTRTLNEKLMRLMEKRKVVKYGTVEFGKIVNYYDLAKKKEPKIALKVPRMFEKGDSFISPIMIKENLDSEQALIEWFYRSLKVLMHFTRKILDVRFAEELSSKRRIEYTENWKKEAVSYASEWMDGYVEDVILHSDASWVEVFGSYEDNPKSLLQAMVKFSEIVDEASKKKERELERKMKSGEIETYDFGNS